MLQNVTLTPSRRTLEFGIYRDGDNNLDAIQESAVSDALQVSAADSRITFTVEDTTSLHGGKLHTDEFTIADGTTGHVTSSRAHDMSDENNLAQFVVKTLDNAQACGAQQAWIDLVDHGGGDGGGLETSDGSVMSMPDIAKAIADGVAIHAAEHPEDAGRRIEGVVANQCLMDTMGFADALSRAGVRYLAASPETMIAPGVPTDVAERIASHEGDARAMSAAIVNDVMKTKFKDFFGDPIRPAAAFDVLDLDPAKLARAESAIKCFNDAAIDAAGNRAARAALREDVRATDGMVRFPQATKDMPWHADRPAISVYDTIASDGRLNGTLRSDAATARDAIGALVLAHRESGGFSAFGGADYSDAAGPTMHFPTSHRQIDPWAQNGISETNNAFYRVTDQGALSRVLA
ncbi:MAG: hypothetical protein JO092_06085 [Candidatus Eremiobacteraeota bacterium]|nr:hypothetical protein [Candidatus Eremiobacteraeota bacterium]MBV8374444.1 hypothetical protein [Candidatus Eremiobacteraeota bacterium]